MECKLQAFAAHLTPKTLKMSLVMRGVVNILHALELAAGQKEKLN
jgi:hypothetical protein